MPSTTTYKAVARSSSSPFRSQAPGRGEAPSCRCHKRGDVPSKASGCDRVPNRLSTALFAKARSGRSPAIEGEGGRPSLPEHRASFQHSGRGQVARPSGPRESRAGGSPKSRLSPSRRPRSPITGASPRSRVVQGWPLYRPLWLWRFRPPGPRGGPSRDHPCGESPLGPPGGDRSGSRQPKSAG